MKKKIESDTDNLSHEFEVFIDDVENLLKEAADLGSEEFATAKAKINERIATTRQSVAEMGSTVSRTARETAAKANREIHEDPWKAIGGAAALGLLLGLLVSKR